MSRALAPRPGQRALLLVGAGHLAGGPRLPVLHDHRPEDDAEGHARRASLYAVAVGLLAALLIAPSETEFWARSRCSARSRSSAPRGRCSRCCRARLPTRPAGSRRRARRRRARRLHGARARRAPGSGARARRRAAAPLDHTGRLPQIDDPAVARRRRRSSNRRRPAGSRADLVADLQRRPRALIARRHGVLARRLDRRRAERADAPGRRGKAAAPIEVPAYRLDQMHVHLEPGHGQGAAIAVASARGHDAADDATRRPRATFVRREAPAPLHETLELQAGTNGRWLVAHVRSGRPLAAVRRRDSAVAARRRRKAFAGVRLTDVAQQVGLNFTPGRLPLRDRRTTSTR